MGGSRPLQDSIAPSGASTVPVHLPELPESVVEVLPVEPRVPVLPIGEVSWRDFERLVFRLARKDPDVVYCAPYGRPGQAQDGIDVYARLAGGEHICWQARNRKHVSASDIEKAVDDFLKGKWAASARCFVLCVQASLADTALQDTIETQAARVNGGGIMLHARRPGGPVAAAQKCATDSPLSVVTRGGGCTAWSSMQRYGLRLSMRG